ncbi:MAG TPA: serine/threonine-protein kinase [Polyangiales bacterium]|nr:serine/threonine-protein kinase [Polyangiales bacterium]
MAELGNSPEPLQIIGNRYRVECCIASGVETSVVGANDCATGKRVALKCWDGPTAEQEVAAVQCFVRSANVSGLFENPHVVEVFGTELGDTISYSISEWLEGSTLARELERVGRLSVRDALRHVLPCMRAVVEAHAVGVIHGDIRPAHIFLCRAKRHVPERARVLDFGRGSPGFHELRLPTRAVVDEFCRYTPPELLSGGSLDARSDVYAFGLLLYEVIAGERIFNAPDLFDLLREIEAGPTLAIGDVTQSLPRGLGEVLYRAMAVKPEERYQELAGFLDALLPFATRTESRVERSERGTANRSTDQPSFKRMPRMPLWPSLNEQLQSPRLLSRVWLSVALLGALLAVSYLAFDDEASEPEPAAPRVTAHNAALHAEPAAPASAPVTEHPERIEPEHVFEPVHVPAEHTHVSTSPAPRRARSERRRSQQLTAEAQAAPPSDTVTEPAASEVVTPLERMQLQ